MSLYKICYTLIYNHARLFGDYYIFADSATNARARCNRFIKREFKNRAYEVMFLAAFRVIQD